jgi:hypothetical protein
MKDSWKLRLRKLIPQKGNRYRKPNTGNRALGIVDGITWVDLPISFPFSKKRVFGNGVSAHVWGCCFYIFWWNMWSKSMDIIGYLAMGSLGISHCRRFPSSWRLCHRVSWTSNWPTPRVIVASEWHGCWNGCGSDAVKKGGWYPLVI